MKALLVMGLLTLSSAAFSSVVKSYDAKNSCNLYRVIYEDTSAKKDPKNNIKANEKVISTKSLYGLALENLDIDFDAREAKVQIMMNIVLGLNKPLLASKSTIDERNPNFSMLVNQLNRKLQTLDQVCVTTDNKLIYARVRETN